MFFKNFACGAPCGASFSYKHNKLKIYAANYSIYDGAPVFQDFDATIGMCLWIFCDYVKVEKIGGRGAGRGKFFGTNIFSFPFTMALFSSFICQNHHFWTDTQHFFKIFPISLRCAAWIYSENAFVNEHLKLFFTINFFRSKFSLSFLRALESPAGLPLATSTAKNICGATVYCQKKKNGEKKEEEKVCEKIMKKIVQNIMKKSARREAPSRKITFL